MSFHKSTHHHRLHADRRPAAATRLRAGLRARGHAGCGRSRASGCAGTRADRHQGNRRQPLRPDGAVGAGRLRRQGTLIILVIMSMGSWYILVTKLYESFKLSGEAKAARSGFFKAAQPAGRRQEAEGRQRVPLHRRNRHRGERAPRRRADREHRPQHLGHDERAARGRRSAEPPAGRPGVPGHGRFHGAVRRPVRHGLGHLPRADRHRHRRPGVDRQGGRPGGRGADHDGHRPGRRGAGGAGLQLAGAPQQGDDGRGARLRRRPARRADGRRRRAR